MYYKPGDKVIILPHAIGYAAKHKSEIAEVRKYNNLTGGINVRFTDNTTAYCYNEEVKPYKEENKMFDINDIKPGMMVRFRNGDLAHVVHVKDARGETDAFVGHECSNWTTKHFYNNDLTYGTRSEKDIIEVYDFRSDFSSILSYETHARELLWKREEVKEVTMADVEKAFGCKVKIIKES